MFAQRDFITIIPGGLSFLLADRIRTQVDEEEWVGDTFLQGLQDDANAIEARDY